MGLYREVTYTFSCDWGGIPACLRKLVVRGKRTRDEAIDEARRQEWSVASIGANGPHGYQTAKCPDHSYKWFPANMGRPRRRVGKISYLPPVRRGRCTGCRDIVNLETGACSCGTP